MNIIEALKSSRLTGALFMRSRTPYGYGGWVRWQSGYAYRDLSAADLIADDWELAGEVITKLTGGKWKLAETQQFAHAAHGMASVEPAEEKPPAQRVNDILANDQELWEKTDEWAHHAASRHGSQPVVPEAQQQFPRENLRQTLPPETGSWDATTISEHAKWRQSLDKVGAMPGKVVELHLPPHRTWTPQEIAADVAARSGDKHQLLREAHKPGKVVESPQLSILLGRLKAHTQYHTLDCNCVQCDSLRFLRNADAISPVQGTD